MAKKLYRSPSNRFLGGVLGGFAEYFGIQAWIVRLVFIILLILPIPVTGIALILAYVALWALLPLGDDKKQLDPNTIDADFEVKE